MKLVNENMKNAGFNIAGEIVKTDAKGVIEVKNKEVAKILVQTAGFAPLKKGESLDVEPETKQAPAPEIEEDEEEVVEASEDISDEEAEMLADKEAEEALLKAEKEKEEEAKKHKWLPGKNNKKNK